MKKRFTLIGLIASMLVLSACGNATEQYTEKQQALIDEACIASEYYIETLDEYATMPEIIEMYNAGDEELPSEISGWIDTQQVIGILANSKVSEDVNFDGNAMVSSLQELLLYEIFSCLGTVGFFNGVEPFLPAASKIILCLLMFVGRLGPITFFSVFQKNMDKEEKLHFKYVEEDFLIG